MLQLNKGVDIYYSERKKIDFRQKEMKRQRVYIDRPQTTEIKNQISSNYVKNIAPYQLLVESIHLQNKQIYRLQQKYLQLLEETKQAKNQSSYTENEKEILRTREQLKIQQRKKFVEEGLKTNSSKYQEQFQKQKKSLQEVLQNKKQMLKDIKAQSLNIFFNLEEHILDDLIDFAQKQHTTSDQNLQKSIEETKWWKRRYQIQMKTQSSKLQQKE